MALEGRTLTVECPCPGTPHEADTITFHKVLSLAGGIAAVSAIRDGLNARPGAMDGITLAEHLFPVYLAHAVEAWTFTAEDGEPLPLDAGETLPFSTKYEIADAADDLFGEEVTRPLVVMTRKSSPHGPTAASTSRTSASGGKRRPRSAPSSPATSAAGTSEE
jgi:hypothetical protein